MPLSSVDVGRVVQICQRERCRVGYGALGAAIGRRAGNRRARPQDYAQATVAMLNAFFGKKCPAASWVVNSSGLPSGYGVPPNALFDSSWSDGTPMFRSVPEFLAWLDRTEPGWDAELRSRAPRATKAAPRHRPRPARR